MAADTRSPRDASWVQKMINRVKTRRESESAHDGGAGGEETSRAEYVPKGRVTILDRAVLYQARRIHSSPLMSGLWVSMIVRIGTRQSTTKDSLTDTVTRVPGEYQSEAEALEAAKRYIDEEDARQQE